jgi:hypothetical protein
MRSQRDGLMLDEETVEALLSGRVRTDAPPGYARVALVLAAAADGPSDREVSPAVGFAVRLGAVAREAKGRRGHRSFRLSFRSKVAALGMALLLVLTGSLAAAGALPDGAQRVAHNVLKKVGVHVPGPNPRAGTHPFERGKSGKLKKHVPGQGGNSRNPHSQPSPTGGL